MNCPDGSCDNRAFNVVLVVIWLELAYAGAKFPEVVIMRLVQGVGFGVDEVRLTPKEVVYLEVVYIWT